MLLDPLAEALASGDEAAFATCLTGVKGFGQAFATCLTGVKGFGPKAAATAWALMHTASSE